MTDCNYCDASFDDEDAYHAHLRDAHEGELGPIDRRRAGLADGGSDGGLLTGPVVLGVVGVLLLAVVGAVVATSLGERGGGADATTRPTDLWSVHYHGTIEVVVDGKSLDFSRDRYQLQADAFHFERQRGTRWHVHAQSVTLGWAMSSLDMGVTDSTFTYQGTTYRDDDPNTSVTVTVNGDPVDPSEYVLRKGDHVRIVVNRS